MARNNSIGLAGALLFEILTIPTGALAQTTLPSPETLSAIKQLKIQPPSIDVRPEFREFKIDIDNLPPSTKERLKLENKENATTPLFMRNTLVLQFQPNASKEGIETFLKNRGLRVVDAFPDLGTVKVEGNLGKYYAPLLSDKNANETLLRGANDLINDFKADPIVQSVTPDIVLRAKSEAVLGAQSGAAELKKLLKAKDIHSLVGTAGTETIDWGISNIEADKLWTMPGAQDGALIGVMDVGFARHQAIVFLEYNDAEVDDHGNHVAAIACGRKGVKGVIPNCFVRARTANIFFKSDSPNEELNFLVVFSEIVSALNEFLNQYDDIKVYNLSMGFNWQNNFGVHIDAPENALKRNLIEQSGVQMVSVLERAQKKGKIIFSAAGNDSLGLATPTSVKYASPFNWGAITAREKKMSRSGFIVEAHGPSNKRAPFSDQGGHMSCPGVDVLSAVAHDAQGNKSDLMYGKMSGTSMASPYCAAALVLLSLVRPGYSLLELADCMVASTEKSDTGAPIPKLSQAVVKCPAK